MRELLNSSDLASLRKVLSEFPAVEAAFVFGSAGTERRRVDSDLDLAIDGELEALRPRRLPLLTELARAGFARVDLVFLREAPPLLAYEAVKAYRVAYQREGIEPSTIFSNAVRCYLDIQPYLRYHARAYKRRLLHDQS